MTALAVVLGVVCQFFNVGGQLLLKVAMEPRDGNAPMPRRALAFGGGIACLAGWFFLWVGLMANWDLSRIIPFAGLNPALVAISAWLLLGEHISGKSWAGIALITVGVVVVSTG